MPLFLLSRFHEDVNGIILSFSQVGVPDSQPCAMIMDELPWLHLRVNATALVFTPRSGLRLKGEVIKVRWVCSRWIEVAGSSGDGLSMLFFDSFLVVFMVNR